MKQRFNFYKVPKPEMKELKAGKKCGCSCYYANSGGSSHWDNGCANLDSGLWSPMGENDTFVSP